VVNKIKVNGLEVRNILNRKPFNLFTYQLLLKNKFAVRCALLLASGINQTLLTIGILMCSLNWIAKRSDLRGAQCLIMPTATVTCKQVSSPCTRTTITLQASIYNPQPRSCTCKYQVLNCTPLLVYQLRKIVPVLPVYRYRQAAGARGAGQGLGQRPPSVHCWGTDRVVELQETATDLKNYTTSSAAPWAYPPS